MKNIFTIFILCFNTALMYSQATYQSLTSSNWASSTTWTIVAGSDSDGNNIPDADDFVTIIATHTVNISSPQYFKSLTVQNGAVLKSTTSGVNLGAKGNMDIQGSVTGRVNLFIQSNCTFNSASTYTAIGTWWVQAGSLNITSSTTISKPGDGIAFQNTSTRTINNSGNLTIAYISMNNASCFVNNNANSTLTLMQPGGVSATGSLNATANPNTVTYSSSSGNLIKPTTYFNLTLNAASTKTVTATLNVLNDLTLGANNILNANNFNINIGRNWVNNSTFSVTNQATMNFNGATAQTITGTQSTVFQNLALSNAAGLTVNSGVNVSNAITVNNGNFNSNGNVTLLSDALTTARIAPVGASGSFSGTMIIQQFISTRSKGWHDLSSPVQSSTIMDWDNEMYMSGIGTFDGIAGPAGVDGWAVNFRSVLKYNEPTASWQPVSGSSTALPSGKAFEIWVADDQTQWNARAIDTRGVPTFGTKVIGLSYTAGAGVYAGVNLVGNPFASSIDYSLVNKVNAPGTILILDNSGNYTDYGSSAIIPPHQGFWVTASGAGASISISEASKTTNVTTQFYKQIPNYGIKLIFSSPSLPYYNENKINFISKANSGFDAETDALYLKSPNADAPAIYMNIEKDTKLITNAINSNEDEQLIPLALYTPVEGIYYIQPSVLDIDSYKYAWIENIKTGEKIDLDKSIPINGNNDETNTDYVLHLSKISKSSEITQTIFANDLSIFNTENTLKIKANNADHLVSQLSIYDVSGKLIMNQTNINISSGETKDIDLSNIVEGMYIVSIIDENNNTLVKKILK